MGDYLDDSNLANKQLKGDDFTGSFDDLELASVNIKAVIRKCDIRIIPWVAFLYLLSFLDRSNIGNANIFGLSKDLGLDSNQYAAALACFFIFYVLFEVPSNIVMKAWRPSMWIPIIMISWGIVMIGMGFVQNFAGLLATRILLGVTEAGLFPGIAFFLTQWYRRFEISFRVALFFSAATIAGAFGGLLARLINLMDGVGGYEGWRWIFILEGVATVIAAFASFWLMHDYPDTAKFLTPAERKVLVDRLRLDNDGCSHAYKKRFIRDAILDWKSWFFGVAFFSAVVPLYCFSLFSPTIINQLGYTAGKAQLMSVPPYVAASFMTVFMGWLSDRLKVRSPFIVCLGIVGAIGYGLLLANISTGVSYFALFFAACGIYPAFPILVAWGSNNFGGSLKKSVATGILICSGNSGGVVSSFLFPKEHQPRFMMGHGVCVGFSCLLSLCGVFWWTYATYANNKKTERNAARGREWTAEEKLELEDEGDHVDWFFYTR
ncbi:hypothetical protein CcaverHIS002_0303900 [Cutaneotrichosporon cavernicola]|uniref:Major facilitator superfamily (MFS) profile domain-containing protein n=1 Tax=Cutaneotrichosporon cavernicola TaxID=279322 RepID=A0AA48IIY0_9TREE|nr:uncharacterized protein CcaverHIS019_0303880 [Cutaneotrichosporon cavernicola]BEI82522.1 hypothetical protein CcaverHIS002_0303900 [Cutaneotrichosporon cavernicola]BEI90318.1 hypothetical protein CcaverHIS019_0303880 [Cutaneotrichosporon cavernicola]BEI98094.1 hypothetical protein CcaverHIS631_0303930 [Cutaneotrichosporon cavernicola]BEJ05871.1 hypothetical protein CcaverHIS641_0303930 [Cutaneotrichosporon cavernicola]